MTRDDDRRLGLAHEAIATKAVLGPTAVADTPEPPFEYLLVAYKPNSADYCRGHCQARFDSDFQLLYFQVRATLIRKTAALWAYATEYGEAGYQLTILFKDEDITDEIEKEAKPFVEAIKNDRKARSEADALEKRAAEAIAAEAQERKAYEALKAKYGGASHNNTPDRGTP